VISNTPVIDSLTPWEQLLLLAFWKTRDTVTSEDQCRAHLRYPDGARRRCALSSNHVKGTRLRANVPHAGPDGHLAPLLVSYQAVEEVTREVQRQALAILGGDSLGEDSQP
jgi:LSD1 subclass zinc finger protein